MTLGGGGDRLARAFAVAVAISGSRARADATPTIPPPSVAPTARPEKSPALAASLSATPTVIGAGLVIAGLVIANRPQDCTGDPGVPPGVTCTDHFPAGLRLTVLGGALLAVGPSLGHLYNRRVWTTGLKIRCVAAGVAAAGLAMTLIPAECDGFVCGPEAVGMLVVIGAGATFGVGAVHDAATAYGATRGRNLQLTFAPLRTPSSTAPGLVVQTRF